MADKTPKSGLFRRSFMKTAAAAVTGAGAASAIGIAQSQSPSSAGGAELRVQDGCVNVESGTLIAVIERGQRLSL